MVPDEPTEQEVMAFYKWFDANHDGVISFDEFLRGILINLERAGVDITAEEDNDNEAIPKDDEECKEEKKEQQDQEDTKSTDSLKERALKQRMGVTDLVKSNREKAINPKHLKA